MNDCQCNIPDGGWCERHKMSKSAHWVQLCRTHERYWMAWESQRGPGQGMSSGTPYSPPQPPNELTQQLIDSRLEICRGCDQYMPELRCKKCELGCRNKFRSNLENPTSVCPLKKWGVAHVSV